MERREPGERQLGEREPGELELVNRRQSSSAESVAYTSGEPRPSGPIGDPSPFALTAEFALSGAPESAAWLRVEEGSVDVREVLLDRAVLIIGRRLTCDVVIHDTNVSRQHARVIRRDDGFVIEDTQSSNGTFVNDERLFGPRVLHSGDVIRIGDATFAFEAGPAAEHGQAVFQAPSSPDFDLPDPSSGSGAPDVARRVDSRDVAGSIRPTRHAGDVRPTSVGDDALIRAFDDADVAGAEVEPVPVPRAEAAMPSGGEHTAGTAPTGRGPAGAVTPEAAREALADVGRDVESLAASAARLAERVRQLEGALAADPQRAPGPGTGIASDSTVALLELRRLLHELRTVGDAESVTDATSLLDRLREQPRDVELLLGISKQAPIMAVVMRQHAYLMRLAPLLDEALGQLVGAPDPSADPSVG